MNRDNGVLDESAFYPSSDGKPAAETDWHRDNMSDLIGTLQTRYEDVEDIYVSGNLLLFYERGDRHRHVSPDVFVVKGVPKRPRGNYLHWREKSLDWVLELTSKSTAKEDLDQKFQLYEERLKVKEYFLFDPLGEYLEPRLQGYRRRRGKFTLIAPVEGRLPSLVLDLHLEANGDEVRLYDPAIGRWLPTTRERAEQAEAEEARLQCEVEELKRRLKDG